MALGTRNKQKKKFRPPGLMLTSMMDMFTIILIFLIFSFSENPVKLELSKDLDLPRSSSEGNYSKAVKLILSKKELRLNDELMATVQDGKLTGISDDDPQTSALYQRLKKYRDEADLMRGNDDQASVAKEGEAPHILFLCDKSHNFTTINRVMKTAGLAGYPNFQFAVLEGNKE